MRILKSTQTKRKRNPLKGTQENLPKSIIKDIDFDSSLFTYMDYARNAEAIKYIQKHFDDMIRIYGIPLTYFRKKNTFFEQDLSKKTANPIYGEDRCADYYIEQEVRAFLNITEYQWLYNAMGFEAQEQITIYISIPDFQDKFIEQVGSLTTEEIEVEVEGNLTFREVTGVIDRPEFYATLYGELDDKNNVEIFPKAEQRPIGSAFYKSDVVHVSQKLPTIYGSLKGKIKSDPNDFRKIKGKVKGSLQFPSLQNKDSGPTWKIAPQVGDFFKLNYPEITEEYVITEIFDRILNNNGGINPLLGKFVYQCTATRRNPSHEELKNEDYPQGVELDNISPGPSIDQNNDQIEQIANQIYNYSDGEDQTFGGF